MSFNKMMVNLWHWKLVWKTKLPPKISRFIWTALKGACLTQDNLIRGNFQLVNRMGQSAAMDAFNDISLQKKVSCYLENLYQSRNKQFDCREHCISETRENLERRESFSF